MKDMHYLEIMPDFFTSGVKIENRDYLENDQKIIPELIFNEIINYNNEYLRFIRMMPKIQRLYGEEMFKLDNLAWEIKLRLEKTKKYSVRLYSPFLMRFIDEIPSANMYDVERKSLRKRLNNLFYRISGESSYGKYLTPDGASVK